MKEDTSTLTLESGKKVRFAHPIGQLVKFPGVLVVRLATKPKEILNENVYGVDAVSGKIIWQIEVLKRTAEDSPYVDISAVSSTSLLVFLQNWDGSDLTVRAETGQIVKRGFSK